MASGDVLAVFQPHEFLKSLGGNYPSQSNIEGLNGRLVLGFNAINTNPSDYRGFFGIMPRLYAGGTINVNLKWYSTTGTGNVVWRATLENLTGQDLDVDGVGTFAQVTAAATGVDREITSTTIALDSSAKRDSVTAADPFRLVVQRLGADAADTYANSVGIVEIELAEA